MRWSEISNGTKVFISNDESILADRISNTGHVFKKDLTEQELVIADRLVNKSVLHRRRTGKEIYFVRSTPQ